MKQHSAGFLKLVESAQQNVNLVTVARLQDKIEGDQPFFLFDVREDCEWVSGRIVGAYHLSKGVLESDIEAIVPDHDAEIILYCRGGYRSILAADALQRMGYNQVSSLEGGCKAWKNAGYAFEGQVLSAAEQAEFNEFQAENKNF